MARNALTAVKAKFGLDNSDFVNGMQDMRKATSSNSARMNKALGKTESSVRMLGKQAAKTRKRFLNWKVAAATLAGTGGLGLLMKKSLDAADAIAKNSDAVALTTTQYQELAHAASLSGMGLEQFTSNMGGFTKRVGEAKQGTGALVTFLKKYDENLLKAVQSTRTQEEAMNVAAEAIKNAKTETDAVTLATTFFGRSGARMAIMLKDGTNGLSAMRTEAQKLGLVMDESLLRNAEKANDQMDILHRMIKTKVTASMVEAAPEIQNMTEAFADNLPEIISMVSKLAEGLGMVSNGLSWIGDKLGNIGESASKLGKDIGHVYGKHFAEKVEVPEHFNTPERQKFIEEQMKLRGSGNTNAPAASQSSTQKPSGGIADIVKTLEAEKTVTTDLIAKKKELATVQATEVTPSVFQLSEAMTEQADSLMDVKAEAFDLEGILTDGFDSALQGNLRSWKDWGGAVLDIVSDVVIAQMKSNMAMSSGGGGGLMSSLSSGFSSLVGGTFGGTSGGSSAGIVWNGPRRAEGGPVSAGQSYLVGENAPEIFTPKQDGYIDNKMPSGGGGVVVNNTFNISPGVEGTVKAELMAMMPMIEKKTVASVSVAINRGGMLAKQVGARK